MLVIKYILDFVNIYNRLWEILFVALLARTKIWESSPLLLNPTCTIGNDTSRLWQKKMLRASLMANLTIKCLCSITLTESYNTSNTCCRCTEETQSPKVEAPTQHSCWVAGVQAEGVAVTWQLLISLSLLKSMVETRTWKSSEKMLTSQYSIWKLRMS